MTSQTIIFFLFFLLEIRFVHQNNKSKQHQKRNDLQIAPSAKIGLRRGQYVLATPGALVDRLTARLAHDKMAARQEGDVTWSRAALGALPAEVKDVVLLLQGDQLVVHQCPLSVGGRCLVAV